MKKTWNEPAVSVLDITMTLSGNGSTYSEEELASGTTTYGSFGGAYFSLGQPGTHPTNNTKNARWNDATYVHAS